MHRAGQLLALGARFHQARIVAVDIAHAELGHFLVTLFHLAHRPFQCDHRLLRIGHNRRQQMRNAVIDGEFEHFRIDHDQAALIGPQPIKQAKDHGVDGHRFTGAGGAGNQQMRHAREIDDDGVAADVLAETQRELRNGFVVVLDPEQFAQIDLFAMRVRQFDADGITAGNHCDTSRERTHGTGDVVGQPDHPRRFDARRGLQFVQRHHRTGVSFDDFAANSEIPEHALQRSRIRIELRPAEWLTVRRLRRREH